MRVRFYLDPVTELPHIYNRDVTENEVEEVLMRSARIVPVAKVPE